MRNQISLFSDGGARGNPGPAACAFVVEEENKVLHEESLFLGIATNNVAEYKGLLLGITWIFNNKNLGNRSISFYMDSELIIKQLNGQYRVKDENLKELFIQVKNLLEKIQSKVIFQHILRSKNKKADLLVNLELDKQKFS